MIPISGSYLFSFVGFGLAALTVLTLRTPGAAVVPLAGSTPRSAVSSWLALRIALRKPRSRFALAVIIMGQMMMTAVMLITPVSMNHEGMSLQLVGIVISVHIVGMYALSPVFGWLSDKIGASRVVWLGIGLFVLAFGIGAWDAPAPTSMLPRLMVALAFLGLGWSACLIGGSALLVRTVPAPIRVLLQGLADAAMNFGSAALGALAGPVLVLGNSFAVNSMAFLVPLALAVVGLFALGRGKYSQRKSLKRTTPAGRL